MTRWLLMRLGIFIFLTGVMNCSDAPNNSSGSLDASTFPKLPHKYLYPTSNDTCEFAHDGVCDEPVNCTLGTDSTDCISACNEGKQLPFIAAACAFRNPPQESPIDPKIGTNGNVHLIGHREGTIVVPSGEDDTKTVYRYYRLYVPSTYNPAKPAPLVINMAGHRVDMYALADSTQLQRTADMNRFIVVYADQEFRSDLRWAWWTDWDWTNKPNSNPDLIFLKKLIEKIGQEYNIDKTRIIASGHSRGASMAIIAAFELPDLIAGACPQSGFTEFQYHKRIQAWNGRKIPFVFIHGVLDTDIAITRTGTVEASDSLVKILRDKGWTDNELYYYRLENVAHRWQPQLNQQWWDFLLARPLTK